MSQGDAVWESCARLVRLLNEEHGWRLSPAQEHTYVAALVGHISEEMGETALRTVIVNYHHDHALVASLQDRQHPNYQLAWAQQRNQIAPILRRAGMTAAESTALDLDDLVQVALNELVHTIGTFHFRSRFSTWSYTVIVRSGKHYLRNLRAFKRKVDQVPLDYPGAARVAVPDSTHPEEVTNERALLELIDMILTEARDERLAQIFYLWAIEDWRLVDIGQRVGLSPSRVSVLIDQACRILQKHPSIRAWKGATDSSEPES